MSHSIKIGVSSCLLGQEVRYDGGHKQDRYLKDTLSQFFEFVSFCPEIAIGLGVPRPTIRLLQHDGDVRLVDSQNSTIDHTEQMVEASKRYCEQIPNLSGYILKSKSPSCGMERINLFDSNDIPSKKGVGIFATQLMQLYPNLPVEEEGRLNDSNLRENFIERVFVYYRWQQLTAQGMSVAKLMEFHKDHKLILLAHDEKTYRQLGPLVAGTLTDTLQQNASMYVDQLMTALRKHATRKKHMNVLQHIMGYLKKEIGKEDKQELLDLLERYHLGQVPLIVPLTLLNHHLRKHPQPYLEDQYYLNPYPQELMLRNHV